MGLLIFILLSYSISNIIVFGSILEGFRNFWVRVNPSFFGKLFNCMMCTPFYVGLGLSVGSYLTGLKQFSPTSSLGLDIWFLSIFLDSCLSSGTTWLIHTVQEWFERSNSN